MHHKTQDLYMFLHISLYEIDQAHDHLNQGHTDSLFKLKHSIFGFSQAFYAMQDHLEKYDQVKGVYSFFKDRVPIANILKHGELDRGKFMGIDGELTHITEMFIQIDPSILEEERKQYTGKPIGSPAKPNHSTIWFNTTGTIYNEQDGVKICHQLFDELQAYLKSLGLDLKFKSMSHYSTDIYTNPEVS